MAQYPYRVVFLGGDDRVPTYVVTANDSRQAVRRAMREHRRTHGGQAPGGRIRVKSLTPKEDSGQFYARVGGSVIGGPFATWEEAYGLSERRSFSIMRGMG